MLALIWVRRNQTGSKQKEDCVQTQKECLKAEDSTKTVQHTSKENTVIPWWVLNTAGYATAASATPTQVTAGLTHSTQIT